MAVPPPRHDHSENADNNTPALPESTADKGTTRVVDAEIVHGSESDRREKRTGNAWNGNSPLDASDLFGGNAHNSQDGRQRFQGRFFYRAALGSLAIWAASILAACGQAAARISLAACPPA